MTTTAPKMAPVSSGSRQSSRFWVVVLLAAVLSLLIGGFAGWALHGDTESGATVLAGGGQMTDRQEQFGDFLADYEQAWQSGDGDAIMAMFSPQGSFTALGETYYVADGSLAEYLDANAFPELDVLKPWLVQGDEVLSFHSVDLGRFYEHVTLTADGEILVLSHTILTD